VEGAAKVDPIGMYLESISNGEKFIEIAEKIQRKILYLLSSPEKARQRHQQCNHIQEQLQDQMTF